MTKLRMTLLAASVALAGATTQAQAQRLSRIPAARFFQTCQSQGGQSVCDAYISGVADGITLTESGDGKAGDGKPAICLSPSSGAQLRTRVMGWLSGHTDRLQGDVGPAVHAALAELFPCATAGAR